MYDEFVTQVLEYLEHLHQGGRRKKLNLADHHHTRHQKAYISSLGKCPLQNALKRLDAIEKFPPTLEDEISSMMLMESGTRIGELLQEAVLWHGTGKAEVKVSDDQISGRADIVWNNDDGKHVLEVKVRNNTQPTPRITDVLQAMAYGRLLDSDFIHIVIVTSPFFNRDGKLPINVWTLRPVDDGFYVENQDGDAWYDPRNRPEFLNYERLDDEIDNQLDYLRDFRDSAPPIKHPLHSLDGWQCLQIVSKPRNLKKGPVLGSAKVRCPYYCWSDEREWDVHPGVHGGIEIEHLTF